mmetsp:Transcript_8361/g.11078  ORF Transcript_8361/g.11078 Transcript_8361/m.11078 type:complete len:181 (-) Transcript_8361:427-969(-)|eukprot:CAMPEP_0117754638 /NCGR_PEP_ID=MMETSP0947-20121206/12940_1 /TAXON_ID=44440 /ORGANISM="Chattonella subsalsa, Strain CCMP2191" /LENGTH=180 /DNA_ID=CAMNT_0005573749 /DNA_START=140 /DNA_END=682 /DNA_ORIENTATION=-
MSLYNRHAQPCANVLKHLKDWRLFEGDFLAWAADAKVLDILNGTRVRPGEGEEHAAARAAYDSDYNALWNALMRCLGQRIKSRFKRTDGTASTLWTRIQNSAFNNHQVNIDLQEDKVKGNKLLSGQAVVDWIDSLESDMNDYEAMGGTLTDNQKRKFLFDNCGPKFKDYVNSWYAGIAMG